MFHPAGSHHFCFQPRRLFLRFHQPAVFHLLLPPSFGDDPPPSLTCNPALNLSSETHTSYRTFNLHTSVHKSFISLLPAHSACLLLSDSSLPLPSPAAFLSFLDALRITPVFPFWKSQIGRCDGGSPSICRQNPGTPLLRIYFGAVDSVNCYRRNVNNRMKLPPPLLPLPASQPSFHPKLF